MSLQQSWIEKNIYNVHSFTCYLFISVNVQWKPNGIQQKVILYNIIQH